MPPTAGFVSEWFVFQTVFQGFHLPYLAGRLTLALTGAGLALTAAVAFATFVKVVGLGVLSRNRVRAASVERPYVGSVGVLGLLVLALGGGNAALASSPRRRDDGAVRGADRVPDARWSAACSADRQIRLHIAEPSRDRDAAPLAHSDRSGARLVPQAGPANAGLVRRALSRPERASTTALTFSNAMRTFYSFVYRPTAATERDADAGGYFVTKLSFEHDVAPIFGPLLFQPAVIVVQCAGARLRVLQSGQLNFYLSLIGLLLVLVLGLTLF